MGSLLPSRLGMWRPPLLTILLLGVIHCKRYKRCELAEELRNKHKIVNRNFLANLVCIGHYESGLETDAVGTKGEEGSHDHGLFQISDKYWCERPGSPSANVCNLPCSALVDEDLNDDIACVRRIYLETAQLSGDGLSAWRQLNYSFPFHQKLPRVLVLQNNININTNL